MGSMLGPKRPLEHDLNIEPTWDPSMCTKCYFLQYETPLREKSATPHYPGQPDAYPSPRTPLPGGAIAQIKTQLPALGRFPSSADPG